MTETGRVLFRPRRKLSLLLRDVEMTKAVVRQAKVCARLACQGCFSSSCHGPRNLQEREKELRASKVKKEQPTLVL